MWQAEAAGAVTEEERSNLPPFNASASYWDVMVRSEHTCRHHSYRTDDDEPPEPVSDEEEPALHENSVGFGTLLSVRYIIIITCLVLHAGFLFSIY